jgi:plastocyanin
MMTISRSRLRWQLLAAAALVLALMLTGIRSAGAAPGATATASKVAKVDINHFAFHPPTLTIAKGSQVTFSNSSKVTHTATRNGSFDTGLIKPGKSVAVRFKQQGTFAYHCEIHPEMHGKIIVN